jgi:hypothetical protein
LGMNGIRFISGMKKRKNLIQEGKEYQVGLLTHQLYK